MHYAEALVQFFEPCEATGMEDFSSLIQGQPFINLKLHLNRHYVLRKANSYVRTSREYWAIVDLYCVSLQPGRHVQTSSIEYASISHAQPPR